MNLVISKKHLQSMLIFLMIMLISACSNDSNQHKVANIKLAAEMSLLPATVWIAEAKGFFIKHKVNLSIEEYDSGRNALESMLRDSSINIATVAQTPIVFNSFKKEPYVIFATMAYSLDDIKVLARKDHNINAPEDLKGKKIGATKRSTGHYFLEGFLTHYGYDLSDVELLDINASELEHKLETGEVSAITSWEPHIGNAEKTMGKDNLTLMISPTPFRKDFYFTTQKSYAKNHSDNLQQFLKALVDAEKFIQNNSQESQQIVANRLNTSLDLIKKIWNTFTFEISLEQSIMVNLDDEAVWAEKLSATRQQIPDYFDFIDKQPLSKVKPHGVNLIQ